MLEREVVVVTGASRGIGRATSEYLAGEGAGVVLVGRDLAALTDVETELAARGRRVLVVHEDIAREGAFARIFGGACERFGTVTALVNNAGVIDPIAPFVEADPAAWESNLEINLIAAARACRYALPVFIAQGRGTIVNLSSGAAHRPLESWSAYCVAKAGLAMLTRALAMETAGSGLRVFGLAPGLVDTQMQARIRASGANAISAVPKEDLTSPNRVAEAIAWLLSGDADDLVGRELDLRDESFARRVRASLEG